jgi:uncharacterized protein YcbK (DUF882 family)
MNCESRSITSSFSRRALLLSTGCCLVVSPAVQARSVDGRERDAPEQTEGFWQRPRWVWLRRRATGEQLRLVYWRDGTLIESAHQQISWLLRDVRFERMLSQDHALIRQALQRGLISRQQLSPWMLMDTHLLDILYAYSAWLHAFNVSRPLEITSGFRHLITNNSTEGAARNSHHLQGTAADFMVNGVDLNAIARFGLYLQGGGVGVYQNRGFIHIDKGRVRSWVG